MSQKCVFCHKDKKLPEFYNKNKKCIKCVLILLQVQNFLENSENETENETILNIVKNTENGTNNLNELISNQKCILSEEDKLNMYKEFVDKNIIKCDSKISKGLSLKSLYKRFRDFYENNYHGKVPKDNELNNIMCRDDFLGKKSESKWRGIKFVDT